MDMKLNKFIHERLTEIDYAVTEDDVEEWICEWYMESFKEINCGKDGKPRLPPTWLAGPRWYDRRRRKIAEAKEEEDAQKKLSKEI
tara:strand:- start:768 stop:1025 length:258 start_codon:yes stop_codon:yes gene_type:complete